MPKKDDEVHINFQTHGDVRMRVSLILGLLILLVGGTGVSGDTRTDAILKGIKDRYGQLSGFRLPYQREVITRSMALLGGQARGDLATGNLLFKPPASLRLEQETPQEEVLLTDGETLWWYIPSKRVVSRYSAKEFGKELKLLSDIFLGLGKSQDGFKVSLLAQKDTSSVLLELRPDPPWQEVDKILVTLSETHEVTKVEIHNLLGSITRFHLGPETAIELFDENLFRFSVPEGVRVAE